MVLTHTGATAAEMEPYLASRLRPLTPVVLHGREANAEPVCHPMECVYYGWRDRFKFNTMSDVDHARMLLPTRSFSVIYSPYVLACAFSVPHGLCIVLWQ